MSYALAFTGDARVDFAELDIALQELALDELDRLAASDAPLPPTLTADVVHDASGIRHYIFLRLAVGQPRRELIVLGTYHYVRSASQS